MKVNNNDGKFDKGRYTTIPETENIKLPIGGKIKLGIRVESEKGVTHPLETSYFVCPKEVKAIFGDEPTELTVFFPRADREEVFPQSYEKYGSNNALLCWGDGDVSKTAQKKNLENGRWEDVVCPCEHYDKKYDPTTKIGGCSKVGHLRFMIPSVSIGTFYECAPHGTVSIEELNSAFKLAEITTGGCWAMIPFRMRRVAKKIKIPGTAKMKTHWVVTLEVAASTEEIRRVMAGEILYLGQRRDRQYEIEAPDLSKQEDEREVITQEELEKEEQEEAEERGVTVEELREIKKMEEGVSEEEGKRDLKKDFEDSKAREAKLKEEVAEGKHKIKSYKEGKVRYQEKVEEQDRIFDIILERAKDVGINSFEELISLAVKNKIFETPLAEHLVKKVLATNKDMRNRLLKALENIPKPVEEKVPEEKAETEELLINLVNKAKKAGMKSWKEMIYEGCRHRMPDGKYVFEIETTEEDAKGILIEDPERYKKLEEAFDAIAKSEREEE